MVYESQPAKMGLGFGQHRGWKMGFGQNLSGRMGFVQATSYQSLEIIVSKML